MLVLGFRQGRPCGLTVTGNGQADKVVTFGLDYPGIESSYKRQSTFPLGSPLLAAIIFLVTH